jgi:hypothetical protein
MRTCAFCGKSIEDYRPQAIYCGGPCRAAASRARAARAPAHSEPLVKPCPADDTAQKATRDPMLLNAYRNATRAEEARALRLARDHADLWTEAA